MTWSTQTFITEGGQAVTCKVWTGSGNPPNAGGSIQLVTDPATPTVIPNTDTPTPCNFLNGTTVLGDPTGSMSAVFTAAGGVKVLKAGRYLAFATMNPAPDVAATSFRSRIYLNQAPFEPIAPYEAIDSGGKIVAEGWCGGFLLAAVNDVINCGSQQVVGVGAGSIVGAILVVIGPLGT